MKKFFCIFYFIIFSKIFSFSAGNPTHASILQEGILLSDDLPICFFLSEDNYYISDEKRRFLDTYRTESFCHPRISGNKIASNVGCVIKEFFEIYFQFGAQTLQSKFVYQSNRYEGRSENKFCWQSGFKVSLLEIENTTLGVDVVYGKYKSPSRYLLRNSIPLIEKKFKLNTSEWQIGVGICQNIGILHPYLGVAFRDVKLKLRDIEALGNKNIRMDEIHKVGSIIGISLSASSIICVNAEIRLINENSGSLSFSFRF